MSRLLVILLVLAFLATDCAQADRRPELGDAPPTLVEWDATPSAYVAPRRVSIWLPPGYEVGHQRYPVLYMHDGQNLFLPERAYGGVDWGVDEAMTRLIADGSIRPAIVVGIWNGGALRSREFVPNRVIDQLEEPFGQQAIIAHGGPPLSDNYLRFLVEELKPRVDASFRTLPDRADTFLMGSSFGGLISFYGLHEYPQVFSAAVAFSTHWPGVPSAQGIGDREAFSEAMINAYTDYMRAANAPVDDIRFWTDRGTEELDALYAPFHEALVPVLRQRGYRDGENFIARIYEGTGHHERDWRNRIDEALIFLLEIE